MKRRIFLIVALLLTFMLAACSQSQAPQADEGAQDAGEPTAEAATPEEPAEEPADDGDGAVRVAVLLPGRIDDVSFNQMMYEGIVALREEMGDEVDVTYVENLYEVVDIEPALRDYASQGYDLIIGHGFQFQDPIMAVAGLYPDVHFAIGPGAFMTAENVSLYDADNAQVGYMLGTVAGLATESGIVGSVGGVEVPNIATMHEGFRLAVLAANPDAQVINLYTGDFRDAEATKEAALSMIDQGADVIYASGNGMTVGALEAARSEEVYFMTASDMSVMSPEVVLASTPQRFNVAIKEMIDDIEAGTYGGKQYVLSLQNGGLSLTVHLEGEIASSMETINATVDGLLDGSVEIPEIILD